MEAKLIEHYLKKSKSKKFVKKKKVNWYVWRKLESFVSHAEININLCITGIFILSNLVSLVKLVRLPILPKSI